MSISRRKLLFSGLAGLSAAATLGRTGMAAEAYGWRVGPFLEQRIVHAFNQLPGAKGLKIWSPQIGSPFPVYPGFLAEINADRELFCGSAFKAFALAEFLRQVESGEVSLSDLLDVDERVWSLSSSVLTPLPGTVSGQITATTALEAMIAKSDNTATDMILDRVGAQRVRDFLSSNALLHAHMPDSTRRFFGFIFGAPNWKDLTWEDVLYLADEDPYPHRPIVNQVQTMTCSPSDFVSFYSRALEGDFFEEEGTLGTFRYILSLSEAIPRVVPLGVNGFMKGGSIDFSPDHVLCLAGGLFIPKERWVYFGLMINWTEAEAPDVGAVTAQFAQTVGDIFVWLQEELATG